MYPEVIILLVLTRDFRFSLWSAYALANLKLYRGRLSYLQVLIRNAKVAKLSITFPGGGLSADIRAKERSFSETEHKCAGAEEIDKIPILKLGPHEFLQAGQTRRQEEPWRQRFHSTGESSYLSSPEEERLSRSPLEEVKTLRSPLEEVKTLRSPLEEVEESSEDSSSFSSGSEWPTAGSDCSGEEQARVSSY